MHSVNDLIEPCLAYSRLKTEDKLDWPSHLAALVFAYNTNPHSSTGYQPYEVMFGCHGPAPCDNWLGLHNYDDDKSVTRIDFIDKQLEQLLSTKKRTLKNIRTSNAKKQESYWWKRFGYSNREPSPSS